MVVAELRPSFLGHVQYAAPWAHRTLAVITNYRRPSTGRKRSGPILPDIYGVVIHQRLNLEALLLDRHPDATRIKGALHTASGLAPTDDHGRDRLCHSSS